MDCVAIHNHNVPGRGLPILDERCSVPKFDLPFISCASFISATMDKRSKALFEWSINNATASQDATKTRVPSSTVDPGVIDAILGPDDATLMRESMVAITDPSLPLDDR